MLHTDDEPSMIHLKVQQLLNVNKYRKEDHRLSLIESEMKVFVCTSHRSHSLFTFAEHHQKILHMQKSIWLGLVFIDVMLGRRVFHSINNANERVGQICNKIESDKESKWGREEREAA
jgi:hypothetical protein